MKFPIGVTWWADKVTSEELWDRWLKPDISVKQWPLMPFLYCIRTLCALRILFSDRFRLSLLKVFCMTIITPNLICANSIPECLPSSFQRGEGIHWMPTSASCSSAHLSEELAKTSITSFLNDKPIYLKICLTKNNWAIKSF
jgi:hypothetical protein